MKTMFKTMNALDKNRNFQTCACKTKFVVAYKQNLPKDQKSEKKVYFNKTHLTNRSNN